MTTALPLYRCATVLAAPALNHLLRRRLEQGKEDPARIDERRGAPSRPRPDGALIWLHGASVGEAQSALSLIAKLLETAPHASVLMTTGTVTSARYLATRLPERSFHQFVPLDRPAWVTRFLDHWRPDLALWLESELWPNLLTATRARGVPTALINARLSPRSYASWRRFAGTANALLGCFDLCLAQSGQQEDWLKRLGARKVACVGNLKFSAAPLAVDHEELAALRRAMQRRGGGDRPLWLAASTHEGEEILAADAHLRLRGAHPGLLTIVAPRHPARAEGILETLRKRDLRIKRRSIGEDIAPEDDIYIADTMGELGLFYRLAPLAMIGGSFGDVGGRRRGGMRRRRHLDRSRGPIAARACRPDDAGRRGQGGGLRPSRRGRPGLRSARAVSRKTAARRRLMKAPGFWRHDGLMARMLSPLAAVYRTGASVSQRMTKTRRAPIPVVCVGNLVAGGAGKTPVALSLFERLTARDKTVHFLSRGYGGQEDGPVKVNAERHLAEDVGDEPLLLAQRGFCWVARDRQSGAAAAVRSGADVLLMDDGLQNPSLLKDLSLAVVDGGYGFGNGRLLPAGPLREPIEDGLRRVDAVVLMGEDRTGIARLAPDDVDLLRADIAPSDDNTVAGKTVYAFAGIGRPEKFFETLESIGCRIAATKSFPDHHVFNPAEIGALLDHAAIHEATPVTTEKDWVRLPKEVRTRFATLPIEVRWRDAAALDALLDRIV